MSFDNASYTFNGTGFCYYDGGTWPATQALIAFVVTNIIAHAATIRLPAGANRPSIMLRILAAIVQPVTAGDVAFRALWRWATRWRNPRRLITAFGGDKLEDAATAGALAISIPLKFAPLLVGRWELVDSSRKIVILGNRKYFGSDRIRQLPFKPTAIYPRYIPFIVPSDTVFDSRLAAIRIPPSSNALSHIIAIGQAGLSARQLYLNYGFSITIQGLSSPYLVVIPYMLMSMVNFVANTLVSNFRRVTIIPMKTSKITQVNEVYIVNCQQSKCEGKIKCEKTHNIEHQPRVLAIKQIDRAISGHSSKISNPDEIEEIGLLHKRLI